MKKTIENLKNAVIICIEKDLSYYLSGNADDDNEMIYRDCELIYKNELIGQIEYSAYRRVTSASSDGDLDTPPSGCEYDLTLESAVVTELPSDVCVERTNIKEHLNDVLSKLSTYLII